MSAGTIKAILLLLSTEITVLYMLNKTVSLRFQVLYKWWSGKVQILTIILHFQMRISNQNLPGRPPK